MGQLFKTCRYPSNIGSPLSLSITARPGSRSHSRLGTCSFCNTCKHGEWPSPDVLWRVVRDADLNFLCIMHTCLYRFGWKGKKIITICNQVMTISSSLQISNDVYWLKLKSGIVSCQYCVSLLKSGGKF